MFPTNCQHGVFSQQRDEMTKAIRNLYSELNNFNEFITSIFTFKSTIVKYIFSSRFILNSPAELVDGGRLIIYVFPFKYL